LIIDRAYNDNKTHQLALSSGYIPVVPPLSTRLGPWEYDREMRKRRNELERLFRRLKGYRRTFISLREI
jgi:transposase